MKLHAGALVCFLLAVLFYYLAYTPGAWGSAALAVLFEVISWAPSLADSDDDDLPPRPPG
jgi:hypothetical protein